MTPEQFFSQLAQQPPAPAYLFLGPEAYHRERCRRALINAMFGPEEAADGVVRHDLDSQSLAEVIDDARSLSLFASRRLLYVTAAEGALPRGRTADGDEDARESAPGDALAAYLRDPQPDTVLVFEAARYEFDGEDKTKLERVRKFYAAVPHVVEFARLSAPQARTLAQQLAQQSGLQLGAVEVDLLVEAVGADAARIAVEIEKLTLFAGSVRAVTAEDLAELVPNARSSSVFALVAAVGKGDAVRSLDILDQLVRAGEYLPLALTFLNTQFRLALLAKEAGLQGAAQVEQHCRKAGIPMWRSRAEQVAQTANAFSKGQLRAALRRVHEADKSLRDARPDDRVVMERFVLGMTR